MTIQPSVPIYVTQTSTHSGRTQERRIVPREGIPNGVAIWQLLNANVPDVIQNSEKKVIGCTTDGDLRSFMIKNNPADFLNKPINDSYIKRVAFEYFNSDYDVAQEFLTYLQQQNVEQKN